MWRLVNPTLGTLLPYDRTLRLLLYGAHVLQLNLLSGLRLRVSSGRPAVTFHHLPVSKTRFSGQ